MNNHSSTLNLSAIARQAMVDAGFAPDVPRAVIDELHVVEAIGRHAPNGPAVRDLRSLLWSSIDDQKSLDLDQVEYAESLLGGDVRVMIGIADVDAFVHRDSAIDRHAKENGTGAPLS